MKNIVVEEHEYTLEKNYKNCFELNDLKALYTDYFYDYDYILGDYSADKLRLKGFYDSQNKKTRKINDIKGLEKYLKDFCNYECRYFLLKKKK